MDYDQEGLDAPSQELEAFFAKETRPKSMDVSSHKLLLLAALAHGDRQDIGNDDEGLDREILHYQISSVYLYVNTDMPLYSRVEARDTRVEATMKTIAEEATSATTIAGKKFEFGKYTKSIVSGHFLYIYIFFYM